MAPFGQACCIPTREEEARAVVGVVARYLAVGRPD